MRLLAAAGGAAPGLQRERGCHRQSAHQPDCHHPLPAPFCACRPLVLPRRQPGAGGDAGGVRGAGDAGGNRAAPAQRAARRCGACGRARAGATGRRSGAARRRCRRAPACGVPRTYGPRQPPPLPACKRTPFLLSPTSAPAGEIFSDGLAWPSPVSSSDAMVRDPAGRLLYHYAIINLAAVPEVSWRWYRRERGAAYRFCCQRRGA